MYINISSINIICIYIYMIIYHTSLFWKNIIVLALINHIQCAAVHQSVPLPGHNSTHIKFGPSVSCQLIVGSCLLGSVQMPVAMPEVEPSVTVAMALEYVDQCKVPMDEFISVCEELEEQAQLALREANQEERLKMIEAVFLTKLLGSVSCGFGRDSVSCGFVQGSDDQDKFEPG